MQEERVRVLGGLQDELESIYGVLAPLPVGAVALDEAAWQRLGRGETEEELIVLETPEGLEVGLFVSDRVVKTLSGPGEAWTEGRLQAHCHAVEGVSHFLYLSHRAGMDRPVSQLELELQAEIDKFATLVLSLWERGMRAASAELRGMLFDEVRYHPRLEAHERERYEKANFFARLYCRFLETRYVARNSIEGFLADLRRMYRLGAGEKLSYAAQGAAL